MIWLISQKLFLLADLNKLKKCLKFDHMSVHAWLVTVHKAKAKIILQKFLKPPLGSGQYQSSLQTGRGSENKSPPQYVLFIFNNLLLL